MGWQLIQSETLSASTASVTFSNIPQTYKSLIVNISSPVTSLWVQAKFNNQSNSYNERFLRGSGSAVASFTETGSGLNTTWAWFGYGGDASGGSGVGSMTITLPNYSSSTSNKVYSADAAQEGNSATEYSTLTAGQWANTSPITSIVFANNFDGGAGVFVFGTSFTLYGLI